VTPAALDAVEMVEEVTAAVEDAEGLPQELCHARHQKLGPARTSKVISLPLALATRAWMEICSALPWRRWPRTLAQSNKAAQEWTSGKKIVLQKPAYLQAILVRHAERVKATRELIQLRLKSLRAEKMAIKAKLISAPTNRGLLKELHEVDDQIAKGDIELKDEVKMKLTNNEKSAHSNAWRTHRELSNSLKKSRGKIYSLLLGQCTQVLVDKMKQDADWVKISGSFDPTLLF
jgi:hypothetical protein